MFVIFPASGQSSQNSDNTLIEKLYVRYPDSAYSLLKKRLYTARSSNNKLMEGICYEYMGQIMHHMGNLVPAIENLLAAEKIFREQKEDALLARTLNNLGNVYFSNRQTAFAFARHKEALILFNRMGDHNGLTETYGQIGFIFEKQKKPDSAIYFQRIALGEPVPAFDSSSKAKIFENLGSVMEDMRQFDSALYYFQHALRLNLKYKNISAQVEILNNLGDIYGKTGSLEKGLVYTRQAIALAGKLQDKYQLLSGYRDIARTFKALHQLDSALHYTEACRVLQHKIYTSENSKQIALMSTLYDIEHKNAEILSLNASRRLNSTVTIGAVSVSLLIALLVIITRNRQRLKIKNERAEHENKQKILAARNALIEAELRNKELEEINLKYQLEIKTKSLSSHMLHLIQKNEVLETLRYDLTELIKEDKRDQRKQLKATLQKINSSFTQDSYWEEFRLVFDQVHKTFFTRIQLIASDLTVSELRLISLIKMNLSPQEISTILGISSDSVRVSKYRIKKKLKIDSVDSLTSFIQTL